MSALCDGPRANVPQHIPQLFRRVRVATPSGDSAPRPGTALDLSGPDSMSPKGGSPASASKKRRHTGENAAINVILRATEHCTRADRQYILTILDAKPELENFIATMLRSGTLEKAMRARSQSLAGQELGRKFPPNRSRGPRRFKHLTSRFRKACIAQRIDMDSSDGWHDIEQSVLDNLFYFALATDPETPLPKAHCHPEYEGPLYLVLAARYEAMGSRLSKCSPEEADSWGYFSVQGSKEGCVHCRLNEKDLPLNMDTLYKQADDWVIMDNHSMEAKIFSEELDIGQRLCKAYERHFKLEMKKHDEEFEYPKAADELKDVEAPPEPEPEEQTASGCATPKKEKVEDKPKGIHRKSSIAALAAVNSKSRPKPKAKGIVRKAAPPKKAK